MDLFRQHTINTPKQPILSTTSLHNEKGKKRDINALNETLKQDVAHTKGFKPPKVPKYTSNELSFSFPPAHGQSPNVGTSSLRESQEPPQSYRAPYTTGVTASTHYGATNSNPTMSPYSMASPYGWVDTPQRTGLIFF